ncbi:MAG: folate-binding protein [Gloeocapsa sp. DLM2.Bin57]|nr:MAG: folate-binding protein [Gloeocapsa sp. DLM2.Bin57]
MSKVSIYDRSNWGLLQLTRSDRARFLHNQTTNNILELQPGQSCDTVFVNSTGRTLDLATVYILSEAMWILVSPQRRQFLLEWMDRYIFPMDQVELKDLSSEYAIFTIIGDQSKSFLSTLGLSEIPEPTANTHIFLDYWDTQVLVTTGSGLALPGYTLIIPQAKSQFCWQQLTQPDLEVLTEEEWERLRILQGRPIPEQELTEDYNPLEAGLWHNISFDKGCYIGQETIARLNTYQGVKQRLWGIRLTTSVTPGTVITVAGEKVGTITSCTDNFALGYIRTKAGGEGLQVQVGDISGEVVSVPFLTHEYYRP